MNKEYNIDNLHNILIVDYFSMVSKDYIDNIIFKIPSERKVEKRKDKIDKFLKKTE